MSSPPLAVTLDAEAVQRRTVRVLVVGQAIGALGITIGVTTASLLARDLSGSDSQAGLAQTTQVLGAAGWALLLARLMARRGRRVGLVFGLLIGAVGALLAVLAGVLNSMPVLLIGATALGATTAANAAARYAATDLAEEHHRARALATVVWATTVGAVAGPNLAGPAGDFATWVGIPPLTGPFAIAAVGLVIAAAVVFAGLRPDPLLTARAGLAANAAVRPSPAERSRDGDRPSSDHRSAWQVIGREPRLVAAFLALAASHAVMVSVMIMTPLHMEHGAATLQAIGMVVSIHVLGMFAFAPLSGMLADRIGRPRALLVAAVVLLLSLLLCGISPEGTSWQITSGLFLLGLGWSIGTVAGSTLVAEAAPLESRTAIQGLSDTTMMVVAAAGGALAGLVVDAWGYPALNLFAALLAGGVVGAGVIAARHAAS